MRKIAADLELHVVTLDDEQFRRFANSDPDGFMRGLDRVVIDEIQRAPDLILPLKMDSAKKPIRTFKASSNSEIVRISGRQDIDQAFLE